MYYADSLGIEMVFNTLRRLAKAHGKDFTPAPILKKLALTGKTFRDLK